MTAVQIAEQPAANALPRYLAIVAAIGVLSIGLILWSYYAGTSHVWSTPLICFTFFVNSAVVAHFIQKYALRKGATR